MVDWPEGIPFFKLRSGYGAQPGENVLRTPMEFGPAKVRRRTTAAPSVITGSAYMTREQAQRFEVFWRDALKDGALSFTKTDGLYRRRNLLVQSEDFSAGWTASNVAVASDVAVDPNGTNTADRIGSSTPTNGVRFLSQTVNLGTGGAVTFSAYLRRDPLSTTDWAAIGITYGAVAGYATFNLSTGTVGSVIGSAFPFARRISAVSGGWYRCLFVNASQVITSQTMRILAASGSSSIATTEGADVFVWGAQAERGGEATTYEPTGASYPATHVTRGGLKTYRIVGVPQFAPMGLGHRVSVSLEVLP